MRRPVSWFASALLVGGCAAPAVPGRAGPVPGVAATPTGLTLPPRPRDVSLNGVDPCALLTPAQRAKLGLDNRSSQETETAPLFRGPACSMTGFGRRVIGVDMALAQHNGIGAITGPGAAGTLTPITVLDFPAVLARDPGHPEVCSVDIDVNPGQFIDLAFRDAGGTTPVPQDDLCSSAVAAATAVLTTLLGP